MAIRFGASAILTFVLALNGSPESAQAAGCTTTQARQFDFWIGEWAVSPADSPTAMAESSISLHDEGCVILENWRPFKGPHAHSISSYDASDRHWHQTYVDATGKRTEMSGSLDAGDIMRFDIPGKDRTRMNYRRQDADTVRQWGERLDANGWKVIWDLVYRRRAATPQN